MKILILGGGGMLGHELWRQLHSRHETWVTLRRPVAEYAPYLLFQDGRSVALADAGDFVATRNLIRKLRPAAVLNCVGIIKQLKEANNPIPSLSINSLLPHHLAAACGEVAARLVHFSTDCVFSGARGAYREADIPDPVDLYGRSKLLGELDAEPALTLRTSIIGFELGTSLSLLEWFLSQRGRAAKGYRRAIYSGFTTVEMARIVALLLERHPKLTGLWQVASAPIDKYSLLQLVRDAFKLEVELTPDDAFVCDRTLDASRFEAATGYRPPSWEAMIRELPPLRHPPTLS